ncbi:MAG: hypothetical protein CMQ16_06515 [Gammaproteobacteria bacterium]|nr:hypothetical protein [Gammaproteobacteria bacterium]
MRGVFARSIELNQNPEEVGLIVVAEPIEADVAATQQLQVPLNILEIRVLDHLLVSEQDVVSLSERQLMG